MTFGVKVYTYPSKLPWLQAFYYMTINGFQVFGSYGSMKEVEESVERVKRGEKP
jgi:hypothetical protein